MKKPKKEWFWLLVGLLVFFFITRRKAQTSVENLTIINADNGRTVESTVIPASIQAALFGKVAYSEVATYAQMLLKASPYVTTIVSVANDDNKNQSDTLYILWPSGKRQWIAGANDIIL